MGALRIRCPLCAEDFPVPASVTEVQTETNLVTVVLDRTELYGHLQKCAENMGAPQPSPTKVVVLRGASNLPATVGPSKAELAGRIRLMLEHGAFVAVGGSRACTMCGRVGTECLDQLRESGAGCCAACENGNTHPAPKEGVTCQEWAKAFEAKS